MLLKLTCMQQNQILWFRMFEFFSYKIDQSRNCDSDDYCSLKNLSKRRIFLNPLKTKIKWCSFRTLIDANFLKSKSYIMGVNNAYDSDVLLF